MKIKISLALFFSLFTLSVVSQVRKDGYTMATNPIFSESGVKIEIGYKIPKKPCDSTNFKKAKFALFVTNQSKISLLNKFLSWKLDYINCNNDIFEKTVSIDIMTLNEGNNENPDWELDAMQIENEFYSVKNDSYPDYTKDKFKTKALSVVADSIVGNANIILGETVTLKVVGGGLTRDAKWVWYSGSCTGGTKEGEGPILVKNNINRNTVFYVRGEGLKNNTACVSKQVVVDNNSRPAEGIQGKTIVCNTLQGDKTMLHILGGKKGLNAKWVWYKNNCNGLKEGEGDTIYVSPTKTTTYYVRAEGPTISPTICASHTLQVLEPSIKPTKITVSQPNSCVDQPVTLTAVGGRLSREAEWVWRSQGKSNDTQRKEGTGESIIVYPDEMTEYFVSAQDPVCPSSDETSVRISVKSESIEAASINVQKIKKNKYVLNVIGGHLGDGAKWVWYKDGCEKEKLESGVSSIEYKAKKGVNSIFVRAEGDCNNTSCTETYSNQIVYLKRGSVKKKENFWFLNGGVVAQNTDLINNLALTLGCRWVYVSTKLALEKGDKYSYSNLTLNEATPTGTSYQFTGSDYYSRTSITGGFLIGGGNLRLYFGGGVGTYQDVKQFNIINTSTNDILSTEYARSSSGLNSGTEAEGGIFLRLGSLTFMGGASSLFIKNQTKPFIDYQLSIGIKL
jgi:hypothetical protein